MFARVQFDGRGWPAASIRATQILRCDPPDYRPKLFTTAGPARTWADPLAALDWLSRDQPCAWYGFLSYDLGRWFEELPSGAIDDRGLPLLAFVAGEPIAPIGPHAPAAAQVTATPTVSREAYERQVARCIDYIRAGDVFQINLSQRFHVPLTDAPPQIYARLQAQTPAKYAAYLDFGDFLLLSNSPELFLEQSRQRTVVTRPIKGTRALRGRDDAGAVRVEKSAENRTRNDRQLTRSERRATRNDPSAPPLAYPALRRTNDAGAAHAGRADDIRVTSAALRASVKDAAELNMIIDLERNDLGRVCEIGSVRVTEPRAIETHPTLVHGVATIAGQLRPESTFVDLLRATFPGGSITGAPKIRAMQLIDELEPYRRGPYCGAIGVLRPDGTHTFSIAIRTMVIKDGQAHVQVGGGIVADSSPSEEYDETLVKAQAMFAALGVTGIAPPG